MTFQRFFLLLWFVAVANAALLDEFCEMLADAWPVEGFFGSSEAPLNAQVTGMYFIHHALSEGRWHNNALILEHNTIMN